jgi:hypothetical protein
MFCHLTTKMKGKGKRKKGEGLKGKGKRKKGEGLKGKRKHKKGEGSSSSSRAQSNTSAYLFVVIVSVPFFFIST